MRNHWLVRIFVPGWHRKTTMGMLQNARPALIACGDPAERRLRSQCQAVLKIVGISPWLHFHPNAALACVASATSRGGSPKRRAPRSVEILRPVTKHAASITYLTEHPLAATKIVTRRSGTPLK